jgi:hypothetical protein
MMHLSHETMRAFHDARVQRLRPRPTGKPRRDRKENRRAG